MVAEASQISLVLSGGSVNTSPTSSLGGDPSSTPIGSSINNLFGDITPTEADAGKEDYRCFYMFNDSDDPVYDIKLWISSETESGSSVQIGIQEQDETQRITITGTPTGGTLLVGYGGETFIATYSSDVATFANSIESGLNSLDDGSGGFILGDVSVTAQSTGTGTVYDILFAEGDGKRIHDTITLVSSLTGDVTAGVSVLQNGGPINTIAPLLDVDTTTPGGVTFYVPTEASPITIPRLAGSEGFPIWVRRVTESGTTAISNDGFSLRIRMSALRA